MGEHWYSQTGEPCHFVPKKDGNGTRPTTIRDAKANNWVPSVTNILKCIAKPQLERWKMQQAAMAVLTSPRRAGEELDAFMERVLFTDKEQDQEAANAADLGGRIHAALEARFNNAQLDETLLPWIQPVYEHVIGLCPTVLYTEAILVGNGYAGKTDFIGLTETQSELLVDFKTTKKLPEKCSWPENRLQLSAYAAARQPETQAHIVTANCYISTVEKGKFCLHINPDWREDYHRGFAPLVRHWQWATGYTPRLEAVSGLLNPQNAP